jgi:hypothetical protein
VPVPALTKESLCTHRTPTPICAEVAQTMLAEVFGAIGLEVQATLLRPPHIGQLESHDRQEPALCLQATWP